MYEQSPQYLKRQQLSSRWQRTRGFTLIEIIVVAAIIAIGASIMALALRDSDIRILEREGDRLAALLETARIHSRASGSAIRWQPNSAGFEFTGNAKHFIKTLPTHWESKQIEASLDEPLLLGPEPILPAQTVELTLKNSSITQNTLSSRVIVRSNGLQPFHVEIF